MVETRILMNPIILFRMNVFYCINILEYNFLIYNDTKKIKNDDLKKAKINFKLTKNIINILIRYRYKDYYISKVLLQKNYIMIYQCFLSKEQKEIQKRLN